MKSEPSATASPGADPERTPASSTTVNPEGLSQIRQRSRSPVFVLGCPRSGTTLLYHMLLSAGGFAVYRMESSVFNVLRPCFGDLAKPSNRRRLMDAWIQSRLFERSGLDQRDIREKITAHCRNWGDFIRIVMQEISRQQNATRWADCTPEHILYIPEIKKALPNALVLHIIRDGRDVALSLEKQRWIRPLFPGVRSGLLAAGLYWEWIVQKGRRLGRAIPTDYLEIRFEDLIQSPIETLGRIGTFIHQDLDYEKIQRTAIGSVNKPNTSFTGDSSPDAFSPAGRWKTALPQEELIELEATLRGTLRELGYLSPTKAHRRTAYMIATRRVYRTTFETKLWLKRHTALGRILTKPDLSWL